MGKTSLVHRYVSGAPPTAATISTIGASFLTKRVLDTDTDTTVRLQIWDTAGQERFRSISRLYYRGANACILCYSITSEASFVEMGKWLQELRKELGDDVILHVVGTKADLVAEDPTKRQVPFERCIAYVAENLYPAYTATPPATAGGTIGMRHEENSYKHFLAGLGGHVTNAFDGARSPSSKRSSGFWGQDVGWDCCHEISAENGEGVDEVFRIVTEKLVAKRHKAMLIAGMNAPGQRGVTNMTPGPRDVPGYFDGMAARGSFRVGKDRKSWLGFASSPPLGSTSSVSIEEVQGQNLETNERTKTRGRCC